MSEQIIKAVDDTIKALKATFEKTPTLFYTETDLVCWFTADLNGRLETLQEEADHSDLLHRIVHTEYPTPFRCDMSGGRFRWAADDERTVNNGLHSRGHIDIIVLNPAFIACHTYDQLKAQNYKTFTSDVLGASNNARPMLLYAIEFFFARDEIKLSRGEKKDSAACRCANAIRQDADKLLRAKKAPGFVTHIQHMAFIKGTGTDVRAMIERELDGRKEIMLVFET
jgi:hypothetical protein